MSVVGFPKTEVHSDERANRAMRSAWSASKDLALSNERCHGLNFTPVRTAHFLATQQTTTSCRSSFLLLTTTTTIRILPQDDTTQKTNDEV